MRARKNKFKQKCRMDDKMFGIWRAEQKNVKKKQEIYIKMVPFNTQIFCFVKNAKQSENFWCAVREIFSAMNTM